MAEKITETTVDVAPEIHTVGDGYVVLAVERINSWVTASNNYQKLQTGMTMYPAGTATDLLVRMDVPGVKEGEPVDIDNLSQILVQALEATLPACKRFMGMVEENYEYDPNGW